MNMTLQDELITRNIADLMETDISAASGQIHARPWPPLMIRDVLKLHGTQTQEVDSETTIGFVADYLSTSRGTSISIYDSGHKFLGIAVDEDVMALIKRDGIRALDYPVIEAVQRNRPVCSITDSPVVILNMMREDGWDRIGVSEHGNIIGILHRRDLANFLES